MANLVLKAIYLADKLSVAYNNWRRNMCASPIRLTAEELAEQMKIAESAKKLRRSILLGGVIPDVATPADIKNWNNSMLELLNSGNWDQREDFLFHWWKKTIKRYPMCPDIFQMMRQVQIGMGDKVWASVFPPQVLLRNGAYGLLLRMGHTAYLAQNGQADYVIENFDKLKIVDKSQTEDRGAYVKYALAVTAEDMQAYLQDDPRKFSFFTMHPLGLQVLASCGFSGTIATMEKQFVQIGKEFPEEFKITPELQKNYIRLLNNQLELNLPDNV